MVKPCPKELKCDVEVGISSVLQFSFEEIMFCCMIQWWNSSLFLDLGSSNVV